MTDVALFNTPDGGEITVVGGVVQMSPGLDVSAYISLFGGNPDDNGVGEDNRAQYWGNFIESDPLERLRSRTQNVLRSLPASSANLLRLKDAVEQDLAWLVSSGIADELEVQVSIPRVNTASIVVQIGAHNTTFTETWRASTT